MAGPPRQPINHGTVGGNRAHYRQGVPMCEPCRAAVRQARGFKNPQYHAPCGTSAAYRRHLDRREEPCDPCRRANSAAYLDGKRRRRERPPLPADDPRHGTTTTYAYHGCRCEACTAAQTEVNRQNWLRRKRKAA